MSRIIRTTRFTKTKDTDTAAFDQNGRRIAGGRSTLAAGEAVQKRGAIPPKRTTAPGTTRVTSRTQVSARVSRPTKSPAGRPVTPVAEEDYADDYADERRLAQEEERAARFLKKQRETDDFHQKYYHLCEDKVKLEAYPGFRFGMPRPDPDDVHALGTYKMNLAEYEKQEAKRLKGAPARAAEKSAKEARAAARTGGPPPRTPGGGLRGKTPGKKEVQPPVNPLQKIIDKHRDKLEQQTDEFHQKYWPLCEDKEKLEAYPGFRFGMPVPSPSDLLAVNGYMRMLKELEDAEAERNAAPEEKRLTKAQKAKADMDAKVAAKRASLRPPPRSAAPAKPAGPAGPWNAAGKARQGGVAGRARPGGVTGKVRPGGDAGTWRPGGKTPALAAIPEPELPPTESEIQIETVTELVVEVPEDMETRIFKMRQKAFQKGVFDRPPVPTPSMRAKTPIASPEDMGPPPRPPPGPARSGIARPSGLRAPQARGIPTRPGSQIGRPAGRVAKPLVPVHVVTEGGVGRSILVPKEIATADHNTVVVVKKGTNLAVAVEEGDDEPQEMPYDDMYLRDTRPMASDEMERRNRAEAIQRQRDKVDQLRRAAKFLDRQRQELSANLERIFEPTINQQILADI